MSYLWICLSLFYAASFLKSSASSYTSEVSLKCNETVGEVEAGKNVKLYCAISYSESLENCVGIRYAWNNTAGIITCNTSQYTCEWDKKTYVSLTISGVNKNESYNVTVETDCGTTTSSAINVQVKNDTSARVSTTKKSPETTDIVKPAVLGILATLVVLGILYFLFRIKKGRGIITRTERTQAV